MRSPEYKEINHKHSEYSYDDGDVDIYLFEESLRIIYYNHPLHTNTKYYTRAMINIHSKFANNVYVTAPFNENRNVLIDDTSSTIDQEDTPYDNNRIGVAAGRLKNISVEEMIQIITKE